jgi:phosphotransferase system HPr (HPr) family protein
LEQTVTLANPAGLHARPAAVLVQTARRFHSRIMLCKGERTANAKSMLAVITLGAERDDPVILRIDGPDAEAALRVLSALLQHPGE